MRSMNRNRIVAILATISLLVGSLAVGGLLPTSAVSDGWYGSTTVNTVTKGQFKHFARYTASTTDVVEGTSLILGQEPTGSPYNGSPVWQHYSDTVGNIKNLTDGVIGTSADTTEYTILRDGNTSTIRYLYFDLGSKYEISDFIVASSQYHGGTYGAKNVKIYVANTDTLHATRTGGFTEGAADNDYTLVYSNWGFNVSAGGPTVGSTSQNNATWKNALNFHIQPEDGATVTGQYVCFAITCNATNYGNYFSELAVYGTEVKEEPEDEWKNSTTGRYQNFDRYADLSTIVSGESLVKTQTPFGSRYASTAPFYHTDYNGPGEIDHVTDGSVDASGTTNYTTIRSAANTYRYFYFDLGATCDITDFIAAPAQNGNLTSFSTLRIYVTNSAAVNPNTITKDNIPTTQKSLIPGFSAADDLVYEHTGYAGGQSGATWTDAYNFHIQPTDGETVTGRYVCFEIMTNSTTINLGELAVYGTKLEEPAPPEWTPGSGDLGQYKTWDQYTQLGDIEIDIKTDNANVENLIFEKTAYGSDYNTTGCGDTDTNSQNWYHETGCSHASGLPGYSGGITDGKIATNNDDCANAEAVFRSGNTTTTRYFYFNLGSVCDVTDFVVASSQYGTSASNVLKNIKIYVATEWNGEETFTNHTGNVSGVSNLPDGFELAFDWSDSSSTAYIHHIQPKDGETVQARYVCFAFKATMGGKSPIPIGELAVYGTKIVPADGVYEWCDGDEIPKNNLLAGAYPEESVPGVSNAAPNWDDMMPTLADGSAFNKASVNGELYGSFSDPGHTEVKVTNETGEEVTLTGTSGWATAAFNLGGTYAIDKLLIAGDTSAALVGTWSFSGISSAIEKWGEENIGFKLVEDFDGDGVVDANDDNRYHAIYEDGTVRTYNNRILQYYEVYISTSAADLFDEDNLAIKYINSKQYQGTTHPLPEKMIGSYVGFKMTTAGRGAAHIGELGVYGEAVSDTKIVTVGDSATYGTSDKGRYSENYPDLLTTLLNTNDEGKYYSVYNAGIEGSMVVGDQLEDGTPVGNDWFNWVHIAGRESSRLNNRVRYADILTIMLGANDAANWVDHKATFKEKYTEIVEAYREKNPNVEVYVVTSPCTAILDRTTLEEIVAMQKDLATALGAEQVDAYSATAAVVDESGLTSLYNSRLYLNEAGHAYMAKMLYETITGKESDLDVDTSGAKPNSPATEGATGQHYVHNRYAQLDYIMGDKADDNLIAGKVAYGSDFKYDGTALFEDADITNWYDEGSLLNEDGSAGVEGTLLNSDGEVAVGKNGNYVGHEGGATDGKIAASADDFATTDQVFRSNNTTTSRYFFYNLGSLYNVSDFLVATSQAALSKVRIYVAEDWALDTKLTRTKGGEVGVPAGFTKVYDNWDTTDPAYAYRVQPTGGDSVLARYVCFEFAAPQQSGTLYPIPISELGVYGTLVPDSVGNKTVINELGGQVAGGYSADAPLAQLRMGFRVRVEGVVYTEGTYEGDYTNAKVVVDGVSYDIAIDEETGLPIIGALMARSAQVTNAEQDLVIGSTNTKVQDVHAKKVYTINESDIIFTALVRNVPNKYFGEDVLGRAYVGYVVGEGDDAVIHYLYGEVMGRSVTGVAENSGMQ